METILLIFLSQVFPFIFILIFILIARNDDYIQIKYSNKLANIEYTKQKNKKVAQANKQPKSK